MWRVATSRCPRVAATAPSYRYSHNHKNVMMSRREASFWSKFKSAIKTIAGKEETPRQIQERKDLGMALLAATHCRLRMDQRQQQTTYSSEDLIDQAIEELERKGDMDDKSIVGLRYDLQQVLAPELTRLFETFAKVDNRLAAATEDDERSILLNEYNNTIDSEGPSHDPTSKLPDPEPFLCRKRGALRTLQSFHGWSDGGDEGIDPEDQTFDPIENGGNNWVLDDFGYNAQNADDEVNRAIRQYQTQNLCRSALLRDELGYSVIALRSTIPEAGRGIFVDGKAMAGSILAFFPGEVWPKEHLMTSSVATNAHFEQDDNYQLSLRYDDIIIDARRSPYTVLDNEGSNPWAIAHIANHPSPGVAPNCRTVMLNFTEPMGLQKSGMFWYVPNSYAREPMMLGPKALDRDVIVMHGMGLMASRDVCDEELFYDYRLSGTQYPSWYHVVDTEELENRWHHDDSTK